MVCSQIARYALKRKLRPTNKLQHLKNVLHGLLKTQIPGLGVKKSVKTTASRRSDTVGS
jgi:hypothetical protein